MKPLQYQHQLMDPWCLLCIRNYVINQLNNIWQIENSFVILSGLFWITVFLFTKNKKKGEIHEQQSRPANRTKTTPRKANTNRLIDQWLQDNASSSPSWVHPHLHWLIKIKRKRRYFFIPKQRLKKWWPRSFPGALGLPNSVIFPSQIFIKAFPVACFITEIKSIINLIGSPKMGLANFSLMEALILILFKQAPV